MAAKALGLGLMMLGLVVASARAAPDPVERADGIVRRAMVEQHIPGLQIAVVKDGRIVMSRSYGVADLAKRMPVTPGTVFPINSITKAFTGVAAMREVEAGRLDLSKPIGTYVADLPWPWRGIEVRRLLSHTSGLPTFDDSDGDGVAAWNATLAKPIRFPPGQRFDYNQTNYALVQMAINGLRGRPRDATLADEQFALAGMTHSGFGDTRDQDPNRATSYGYRQATPDQPVVRTEIFSPLHRAAAGMNSTADDMAKWLIALQDGKLLSPAARRTMWTPVAYADGKVGQWGMGWLVLDRAGHRAVAMTGGSRSAVYLYPDDKVGVVILTNLASSTPEDLVDEIAQGFIPGMALTGVPALRAALTGQEGADPSATVTAFRAANPGFNADEHELNDWGYRLLAFGKPRSALAVLKLTADLYPASGNAFDSLGEAYATNGDKPSAIVAYRRALELDPTNKNAETWLKRLEKSGG
ncbi:serine hydrolase [Caulobacter sp. RL271]|uniref:Serine hydrolase n=1 Tax=Caulobacter segnis TaxID=88688 RepID=A0ABY4ZZC4_9CAUL|nr:serine hydrolase [Caulobacter segnis]USQ98145.1 serine hydrolase [Caulobacter segnis]